jgi:hypothetical protein
MAASFDFKPSLSRGSDKRWTPHASTRNDLPQQSVAQKRGFARSLVHEGDNLGRKKPFFAIGSVGYVKN